MIIDIVMKLDAALKRYCNVSSNIIYTGSGARHTMDIDRQHVYSSPESAPQANKHAKQRVEYSLVFMFNVLGTKSRKEGAYKRKLFLHVVALVTLKPVPMTDSLEAV